MKTEKMDQTTNIKLTTFNKVEIMLERLGIPQKNSQLFMEALTHSSYANENKVPDNERLEFLGDSVLSLVVCQYLFERYPNYREGKLAKIKATVVSAPLWAKFARQLHLDEFILLGEGERKSSGNKLNIMADLFEAFMGAYYLSFGLEAVAKLILPMIEANLSEIMEKFAELNAKNDLQELTQARGITPRYRLVRQEGPPHNPTFTVEAVVDGKVVSGGKGKSIKEAENHAASIALQSLKLRD